MLKKNEIITTEINGMTTEGNGVGRFNDIAIFVPMAVIGDILKVKIVKVLKNYCFGIIEEIITPSESRTHSDCEVFTKCGGCSFRQMSYSAELAIKENFVKDAFTRMAKLSPEFLPIQGCENSNYYRNKAQYPVCDSNGQAISGFYSKRSHRIVPFTACKLQPIIFQKITDTVIKYINDNSIKGYDEVKRTGVLRHIYIRQGYYTKEIMVCLVVTEFDKEIFKPLCEILSENFKDIKSIVLNKNSKNTNVIMGNECVTIWGNDTITDTMCGNKIVLSPHSFYQVNTPQAENLYKIAKDFAQLKGDELVLDLYCGAGTIGLSMSNCAKKVIGVEVVPQAIENAKINADINNIDNIEFYCGDAGEVANKLLGNEIHPNVIIVDPPRKGCTQETLDAIIKMSPEKVVMVSCNPSTAARDCKILCENGYEIQKCKAVDMFPRTTHVETVVLMSRIEGDEVYV